MKNKLYEESYKNKNHFSFGKNWEDFIKTLTNKKIEEAKKSLIQFIGGEKNIKEKTFIDIGCGSGLFSLAAYELGAKTILSIDIDDFSINCVRHLKKNKNNPNNWKIKKGSALDENFIKSLGQFDIIYSWGVLHHTGNMYKAFNNIENLIKPKSGIFYLAIYNNNTNKLKEGTSSFWHKIKKFYNNSGEIPKKIIYYFYMTYFFIGLIIMRKNPLKYIKNYQSNRGMSWHHDIIDWLGGFPYEYATPDEIINFFGEKNLYCKKLVYRDSIGCNEYLLVQE